jgi:hypothetical protein
MLVLFTRNILDIDAENHRKWYILMLDDQKNLLYMYNISSIIIIVVCLM